MIPSAKDQDFTTLKKDDFTEGEYITIVIKIVYGT